ncbi:MAG TPA: anion permease [Halococcus sp.]|nr:anion permease [Halococcus sp.]
MVDVLLLVALVVMAFVGYNIGGSNIGVAFGPAVGSRAVTKIGAGVLMTVFFFLGGWFLGREVVRTMGNGIVEGNLLTAEASIVVLFFIGLSLFLGNFVGVPASTSMTGVGSIAGLGLAAGAVNWDLMGPIVSWWIVSPLMAFAASGIIGRYFYLYLVAWFAIDQSEGALLALDRSRILPRPVLGPDTTRRELIGSVLVVAIGCYTAFSAGAGNTATAIAPLVGSGAIDIELGIILAGITVGAGAFTIGRRTIDTVGDDLTEMPLVAALVVGAVSSTFEVGLAQFGVPASVVVISTMSIVGLGWGRASRVASISQIRDGSMDENAMSVGGLAADAESTPTVGGGGGRGPGHHPTPIGEENPDDIPRAADLFRPKESVRVILVQNIVPILATIASYLLFRFVPGL